MISLMQLMKTHPKKGVCILMILLSLFAYKKRRWIFHFTFKQVLNRMNERMMKQMSEQVSNVDRFNKMLSSLQQLTEDFYSTQQFKSILKDVFKVSSIENLKNDIKTLDKKTPNYNQIRTQIFIQLNSEYLIFGAAVIRFSKFFELLIFVQKLIFRREKDKLNLSDDQLRELEIFFENTQIDYLKRLYQQSTDKVLKTVFPLYSEEKSFAQFIDIFNKISIELDLLKIPNLVRLHDLYQILTQFQITSLKQLFQKFKSQLITTQMGENETNQFIKNLNQARVLCGQALMDLLEINQDENTQTFFYYSQIFSFRKLMNRFKILEQKSNCPFSLALLKQGNNLQKICLEEFLLEEADRNNEQFYQKKIKQGFTYVNGQSEGYEIKQLAFTNEIIEESQQNKMLNLSIRQLSRKIFFQGEFMNQDLEENENDDQTQYSEFAEKFKRFAFNGQQ